MYMQRNVCVCVFVCVCVCWGVYDGFEGFRCISDASYHIWVTAAVPQGLRGVGGVRNRGFRGGGQTSTISGLKSAF